MSRIHVAILTFNNCRMLVDLLHDVQRQTLKPAKVFVVDNASEDDTAIVLHKQFKRVIYERLNENAGSSGGYHRLIERAYPDADFVWTLDDDVRLEPDALEKLVAGYDALSAQHRLAAVRSAGRFHRDPQPTRLRMIPWRGTLFRTSVIQEIGLPRNNYFLYGDDFEYSLRIKKRGYVCYWIPSSKCSETRSANKIRFEKFGKVFAIYSSPFRHYYGFRNEINILLEYRRYGDLFKTLMYAVKVIAGLVLWYGDGKSGMIAAVLYGVKDGFGGRLGKNPRYLP
ncbi:MAG: glycosyltransferase [Chitinispirillaceae bacterium]|nr:glycosyltransferase [Chitinispirillaceae bacterium]